MTKYRKMSLRDHRLLEDLETKYTPEDIAAVIQNIGTEEVATGVKPIHTVQESVLDYIKRLEGYRIRLRELHWQTTSNSEHMLTNNMLYELTDLEDSVAEDCMGMLGIRFKVGDVVPIMPEEDNLKDLLQSISETTCTLRASLNEDKFPGLISLLDDCLHRLSKDKYLDTLS